MKRFSSLAWKELKAQRVTSVLILAAVILSTIMTTVVGQSIGILNTMRMDQAAQLNGRRHASFHNVSVEGRELLLHDDRLSYAGSAQALGVADLSESGMTALVREYQGDTLETVYPQDARLKEGRLPQTADEIALPEDALKFLGVQCGVGDPITLSLRLVLVNDSEGSYEYSHTFRLSGILESNYLAYSSGTVTGIAGPGAAKALLPPRYQVYSVDFLVKELSRFQETVNELRTLTGTTEKEVQYNWIYLSALGAEYEGKKEEGGAGFSFMAAAGGLIGALVLLAAGLVIYNILKISVAKRVKQYGTLRAIGAERGQLYRLLSRQLLLLCGAGIPTGLCIGALAAKTVLRMALSFLSPGAFRMSSAAELVSNVNASHAGGVWPLVLSAAVTLLFAFLAAVPAASYAARVSPTEAMNGTGRSAKKGRRKPRRIRSFEAYYARLNLGRSPGRTAITILSIAMAVAVFVSLQSFAGLLDASRGVKELHTGDYSAVSRNGFTAEKVRELKKDSRLQALYTEQLTIYQQDETGWIPIQTDVKLGPADTFQLASADRERLSEFGAELSADELERLLAGEGVLVKNPIPISFGEEAIKGAWAEAGDTVNIAGKTLDVLAEQSTAILGAESGFTNGIQFIMSEALYGELTGGSRYAAVYPQLKPEADSEALEQTLNDFCGRTPGSTWISYRQTDAQLAESFEQIKLLCWGLILFISLIGVLNIMNTVYTNIHTRIGEIGMQRAIGMSVRSLYQTFLWEGVYYAMIAAALGAAAGSFCTAFVNAAATGVFTALPIPYRSIIQAAAVSVAACFIATALPLRSLAKMSIVDSIDSVE